MKKERIETSFRVKILKANMLYVRRPATISRRIIKLHTFSVTKKERVTEKKESWMQIMQSGASFLMHTKNSRSNGPVKQKKKQ